MKYFKLFEQHRLYDRLPSGFKIVRHDKYYKYNDTLVPNIYITDSEYNILSNIEATKLVDNYNVGGSASKVRGLGALVYEFVMMSIYPSGLMPNRDGDVREKAFNIWEKFYERTDLEKESIPYSNTEYSIAIATGEDEPTTEEENREFYEESSTEYQKTLDTFNTAYKMKPNDTFTNNIVNLDSLPIEIQDKIKEEEKMFFANLYENKSVNSNDETMVAYHGSPVLHDYFSNSMIGTGEGETGFGYGFYFSEDFDDAKDYAEKLEREEGEGAVYTVNIPNKDFLLNIDLDIEDQSDYVKHVLNSLPNEDKIKIMMDEFDFEEFKSELDNDIDEYDFEIGDTEYKEFLQDILNTEFMDLGNQLWSLMKQNLPEYSHMDGEAYVSDYLNDMGIKGNIHNGFHYDNYVIFNDEDIEIVESTLLIDL
jgi:hypothetical protein